MISAGKIRRVFGGYTDRDNVLKAQIPVLPNNKRDINDVSTGHVRLSLPGDQLLWPEGDAAARRLIYEEHVRWNVGLIYFLQTDARVPPPMQADARTWGWCKDEFVESGHIPPQLYVREARRMQGLRLYSQADTRHAEGDARAVLHRDAIAIGDYGHSSHGTSHEGSRFGGTRHGEGLPRPGRRSRRRPCARRRSDARRAHTQRIPTPTPPACGRWRDDLPCNSPSPGSPPPMAAPHAARGFARSSVSTPEG